VGIDPLRKSDDERTCWPAFGSAGVDRKRWFGAPPSPNFQPSQSGPAVTASLQHQPRSRSTTSRPTSVCRVKRWGVGGPHDAASLLEANDGDRVRGAIWIALAFGNRAAELGVTRSFGSTGDCYDNAAVEALWATLKRDLNWIYGKQTWRSRSLLRSAIFDYVEGFYNPERTQKRLGYRSPADFESAFVA